MKKSNKKSLDEHCEEVCSCLHASLICGEKECIYDEGELNFWRNVEDDDDFLCLLSPNSFEATFVDKNGIDNYRGVWNRILSIIGPDYIERIGALDKDIGVNILTDGGVYVLLQKNKVLKISACPILLREIEIKTNLILDDYYINRIDEYVKININRQITCSGCGKIVDNNGQDVELPEDSEEVFCRDCYWKIYTSCDICNGEVLREEAHSSIDYDNLCDSCYDNHYVTCKNCNKEFNIDECIEEDYNYYCEDCHFLLFEGDEDFD